MEKMYCDTFVRFTSDYSQKKRKIGNVVKMEVNTQGHQMIRSKQNLKQLHCNSTQDLNYVYDECLIVELTFIHV